MLTYATVYSLAPSMVESAPVFKSRRIFMVPIVLLQAYSASEIMPPESAVGESSSSSDPTEALGPTKVLSKEARALQVAGTSLPYAHASHVAFFFFLSVFYLFF